ncbi:MAG: hypothetical protein ACYTXI_04640 [Nostoc sp.]
MRTTSKSTSRKKPNLANPFISRSTGIPLIRNRHPNLVKLSYQSFTDWRLPRQC